MSKENADRRSFLKAAAIGVAFGVAGQTVTRLAHAQTPQAGTKPGGAAKLDMVKPTDANAQALGYVEVAEKADVKKFPKRATAEGKKQFCYNCQFYQSMSDNPKAVPQAPCTIFANKGVKGAGWCNSWVQNPKVKS